MGYNYGHMTSYHLISDSHRYTPFTQTYRVLRKSSDALVCFYREQSTYCTFAKWHTLHFCKTGVQGGGGHGGGSCFPCLDIWPSLADPAHCVGMTLGGSWMRGHRLGRLWWPPVTSATRWLAGWTTLQWLSRLGGVITHSQLWRTKEPTEPCFWFYVKLFLLGNCLYPQNPHPYSNVTVHSGWKDCSSYISLQLVTWTVCTGYIHWVDLSSDVWHAKWHSATTHKPYLSSCSNVRNHSKAPYSNTAAVCHVLLHSLIATTHITCYKSNIRKIENTELKLAVIAPNCLAITHL